MIPKTIHYVWFGGNEKPKSVLNAIETWRTNLPDYEIRERSKIKDLIMRGMAKLLGESTFERVKKYGKSISAKK